MSIESPFQQVGALPYRVSTTGEVEILLVTSRGTRQWIIPKGWPMEGLSDPDAAAREAYEEAGLIGEIESVPIGVYTYEKQRKGMDVLSQFSVDVYRMRVDRQLAYWPEARQRTLVWVSPVHAQSMVTSPSLMDVIMASFS